MKNTITTRLWGMPIALPIMSLLLLLLLFTGCKKDDPPTETFTCEIESPQPKGDRLIGLDLLNITETNTFEDNIDLAKELKTDYIALHTTWSGLEPSPNNYTDPIDAILLLGQTAQDNGFKFSLTLRPIDATGKTVPSDLENLRFNDEQMINRFKALLDYVFTRVEPSVLLNLQIGNEIDGYDTSNEHPDFWLDYSEFLAAIQQYMHATYPGVLVGYTAQLDGLLENPSIFSALNNAVDILGVTYYPLKSNFDVKAPSAVIDDLNELMSTYDDIDIYLQEIGCQSSARNNSSEAKQAEFFCNFFTVWDTHADRLKAANIVRLNDLSEADAEASAGPYGISSTPFIEYLRTLGLRSFDGEGQNKQAFQIIKDNLEARGW